jgi:hypothetical protein
MVISGGERGTPGGAKSKSRCRFSAIADHTVACCFKYQPLIFKSDGSDYRQTKSTLNNLRRRSKIGRSGK